MSHRGIKALSSELLCRAETRTSVQASELLEGCPETQKIHTDANMNVNCCCVCAN